MLRSISALLVILLASFTSTSAHARPTAAEDAVARFEKDADAIRAEADTKLKKRREALVEELKKVLDRHVRDKNEDEAKVVRTLLAMMDRTFAVGTKVDVEWKGTWWPAEVIKVDDGKWRIRYDGYDETWDEWIDKTRIRPRTVWELPRATYGVPAAPADR